MRGPECCFSFEDLFVAANGRTWAGEEAEVFRNLSQAEKNDWVSYLVSRAPQFVTEDRIGEDGITYRAFWVP